MAFIERFYIATPAAAGDAEFPMSDGNRESFPAYRAADGSLLAWSSKNPLPAIGEKVTITMNGIGPAIVDGYFVSGDPEGTMYLGVMTRTLHPPAWLREQNKRDAKNPSKPAWYRAGIGCEFGTEIRPYAKGDMTRHQAETRERNRRWKERGY